MWTFRGSCVFEMNRSNVDRVMEMMNVLHNNKFIYYYYKLRCSRNESYFVLFVCVVLIVSTSPTNYYLKNLNNKTKPNNHIAIENNGTRMDGMKWTNNTLACGEAHLRIAQDIWECAYCVRLYSIEAHQMNALPWLKWAFHNLLGVERIYHYRVWHRTKVWEDFSVFFFAVAVLLHATWIYCFMRF